MIYKIKKVKKEKSESQKNRWKKREWKVIEEKGEKKKWQQQTSQTTSVIHWQHFTWFKEVQPQLSLTIWIFIGKLLNLLIHWSLLLWFCTCYSINHQKSAFLRLEKKSYLTYDIHILLTYQSCHLYLFISPFYYLWSLQGLWKFVTFVWYTLKD